MWTNEVDLITFICVAYEIRFSFIVLGRIATINLWHIILLHYLVDGHSHLPNHKSIDNFALFMIADKLFATFYNALQYDTSNRYCLSSAVLYFNSFKNDHYKCNRIAHAFKYLDFLF